MSTSTQTIQPKVYSVTQLSKSIRNKFREVDLTGKWFEGEISGWNVYSSGHAYFVLKDENAQIRCVLFAGRIRACQDEFQTRATLGAKEINGLKVHVAGDIDVNMSRGEYTLVISRIKLASGLGDRMLQFKALREKLTKEGLNKLENPQLRRPLPFLPHRIGIITSRTGAVIHDMCDVLLRRFPNIEICLYPAKVQGEGAERELAAGVEYFNRDDSDWKADVLIIGRGGGSMEDLWCFNEERLVYAVAASKIPVVSAVGHETDFTLCDYVADKRAGTPSIAAETVVPVKSELENRLQYLSTHLRRALEGVAFTYAMQIDNANYRLANSLKDSVVRCEARLQNASLRLLPAVQSYVQNAGHALERTKAKLELLSPYSVLQRGYSITTTEDGNVVKAVDDVEAGMTVVTRLSDGSIVSTVK